MIVRGYGTLVYKMECLRQASYRMIAKCSSLRVRLMALVLIAILPFLALAIHTHSELQRLAERDARMQALSIARIVASDQKDAIHDARQLLYALTQVPEVRYAVGAPDDCARFLFSLNNQYPQYMSFTVATPDGAPVCGNPHPSRTTGIEQNAAFQTAVAAEGFGLGVSQSQSTYGGATLDFGYAIRDSGGQIVGAILATLDLSSLNQLAADAHLPPKSTLTVVDERGIVLVRFPDAEAWIGRSIVQTSMMQVIREHADGETMEEQGLDGIRRLFAAVTIPDTPTDAQIYVSVGIPCSEAFAAANRVLIRHVVALAIVLIVALSAAWLGGDWIILRSVRSLVHTARRLGAGDLDVRTDLSYEGELGELARAFDDMAGSQQQRVAERTRRLSVLVEVMAVVNATLDPEVILRDVLDRVLAAMGGDVGAIHLLDETSDQLVLAAATTSADHTLVATPVRCVEVGEALAGLATSAPITLSTVTNAVRPLTSLTGDPEATCAVAPLKVKGRILGTLSVSRKVQHEFSDEETSILSLIAEELGVAIDNARLNQQAQELAVVRERERLARELHDSVTQSLYSLTLLAEAARQSAISRASISTQQHVARLGEISQQALREMRLLVYELRPPILQRVGLVGALRQRLDVVEKRAGIRSELTVEGHTSLPAYVEQALYRIAEEALNNATKHAVASVVEVRLSVNQSSISLDVVDDGQGFDLRAQSTRGGLGLIGMKERAEEIGGTLTIETGPGMGTRVHVDAPLDPTPV
ncbi:MAG: GAF domain-containing protein [Chloroflexi bacterium]|nr:GAF domain-containing protein [Chloroflexota bacterium]